MPLRHVAGRVAAISALGICVFPAAAGEPSPLPCLPSLYAGAALPEPEPGDDLDGDGLSDEWENHYFGNLRDQSSTDDPDGDGENNLAEMQAQTNPLDPSEL
jgi:hypothetical protein